MTRLQIAVQAVLDRWESPLWKNQDSTASFMHEMRDALAAELAQDTLPISQLLSEEQFSRTTLQHNVGGFGGAPPGLIDTLFEAAQFIEAVSIGEAPVVRFPLADELSGFAHILAGTPRKDT